MASHLNFIAAVIVVLFCFARANEDIFANYETCRRQHQKQLIECVQDLMQGVSVYIKSGNEARGIPKMDPLEIDELDLSMTVGGGTVDAKLKITDSSMHGLSHWNVSEIDINTTNGRVSFLVHIPRVRLNGDYTIDGKIVGMSVGGSASYMFLYENMNNSYVVDVVFNEELKRAEVAHSTLNYTIESGSITLNNLFYAQFLTDAANRVLNTNFMAINEVTKDTLAERFKPYFDKLFNSILANIPEDLARELYQMTRSLS